MAVDILPEEKAFIEEIGRRVRPEMGVVIKTKKGEVIVTQGEKTRLDLIAHRENFPGAADLVNFYQAP
jgi:hypothetical protein